MKSSMSLFRQTSSHYARAGLISAFVFISYAYFYAGTGANQNSRFDLVRAIVERHTLRIDGYHLNTIDKAFWNGHFYSDKAPGQALAAVPVFAVTRAAMGFTGANPVSRRALWFLSYVATVTTVALPSAIAAACLYFIGLALEASWEGALFAALCLALATPMWCYGTAFFSHALTASCLVFSFAAAVALRDYHSPFQDALLGALVGLAGGWATITEFPAVVPSAVLAILAVVHAKSDGVGRVRRVAPALTVTALVCLLVLWTYQVVAFGSLFNLGYKHHMTFRSAPGEYYGLSYPRMFAVRQILIGSRRGLLPLAPVVGMAPFGLVMLWKMQQARSSALAATAIALYFLLFNASFADWHAGRSYGPRYLSPGLPFLCVGLGQLWTWARPWLRGALAVLALYGAGLSLIAVSTAVTPPDATKWPVQDLLWPAFRSAHLSLNDYSFNLGNLAGLRGLAGLLPLFGAWSIWLALCFYPSSRQNVMPGLNPRSSVRIED